MVGTLQKQKILRRGGRNTQKNYTKKDLHGPDNHNGVITHLEPDILECEVKWALGSITRNKASGGDRIAAHLFEILKDDAVKVLYSICQQIWKTQQWPQDWKRSVFISIPAAAAAAAVKSLQSCPTLCNPIDGSPPGSPVPGILQCSCLENLRDGRAWWAAVYGVAQSRTRLNRLSSSSCSA